MTKAKKEGDEKKAPQRKLDAATLKTVYGLWEKKSIEDIAATSGLSTDQVLRAGRVLREAGGKLSKKYRQRIKQVDIARQIIAEKA